MATEPTVSVVIPTHNRADLLQRAVCSVLGQTFGDLELIVVDDASTDNTERIMRSFERTDRRVRYLKHAVNRRQSAARNTGIDATSGAFIAFLDDDDEWLPTKLENQLALFSASKVQNLGLVYCGAILIDAVSGAEMGRLPARKRGDVLGDLLDQNCISGGGSTPMVKKEVFERCGLFDPAHDLVRGTCEDWEMWLRISSCYAVDFVDGFLARYSLRSGASLLTKDLSWADKAHAHQYILHKYSDLLPRYPRAGSNALNRAGRLYMYAGMTSYGRNLFLRALRLNPSNPKAWLSLLASLFGPRFYRWAYERAMPIWGNPDYREISRAALRSDRRAKV